MVKEKKENIIWALLVHLGYRMWGDEKKETVLPDRLFCDHGTWRKVIDRMAEVGMNTMVVDVGEGIVLPSHPELAVKGSWTPEKMRKEIEYMKSCGIEAIPKLNFSTLHDAWLGDVQYEVSTPRYYQTCSDVIRDVAEIFGNPRLFNIGMDEESDMGLQDRYDLKIVRQGSLYWHDVNFLADEVEKHGARAWMFGDDAWFRRESFYANFPKRILLSNWFYGRSFRVAEKPWQPPRINSYREFDEHGFDQIPTATNWYPDYLYKDKGIKSNDVNFPLTVAHCRQVISPERLKGFLMTTWAKTLPENFDFISHAIDLVGQSMII